MLSANHWKGLLTTHLSTINNLQVYDLSGKLVHVSKSIKNEAIDLTFLPSGFYTIQLEVNKELFHQKLIIE